MFIPKHLQLQVSWEQFLVQNAMGKRLRSLASVLWDHDTEEQPGDYFGVAQGSGSNGWKERELQLENDLLKSKAHQLCEEVDTLKKKHQITSQLQKPSQHILFDRESYGASEKWVHNLRDDVVCLSRLHLEVMPELVHSGKCSGCIIFDLPKSKSSASQVARHCEVCISKLSSKHPAVFKVGITSNPVRRWMHPTYGYTLDRKERWQGMKVLFVAANSFSVALLECFMISKFKGTPGCRNENPGGESACPGEGPHFLYAVFRILVPPPRVGAPAS